MSRISAFAAAPAFVLLMGGVAHAALTADQVWAGWKDAATSAGLTVTAATEVSDGGVLTLNGVTVSGAGGAITMSDMTLTEENDGSVTVEPASEIKLDLTGEGGSGTGLVTSEALVLSVSEGETGLDYGFAADTLNLAFDRSGTAAIAPAEGTVAAPATASGTLSFTAVEGGFAGAAGDNNVVSISLAADLLAYDIQNADPSAQMKTAQTSSMQDLVAEMDLTLPKTLALSALTSASAFSTALSEGMALEATFEQGATKGTSVDENPFLPLDMAYVGAPGKTTVSMDAAAVVMDSEGEGMEITLKSAMIPAPQVTLKTGALAVGLTMPLMAGQAAGDYRLLLNLADVVLGEEAWALFDAGKVLPRDPAQLELDLGGKIKMDVLALAAAQEGGMAEVTPPEPQSFDIRALSLSVAGAVLTGAGAFTFDNSAVGTGGAPVPVGKGEVALTGGNALIDGLIKTGLMTEDDAVGMRMMIGAFATPGAEPDSLTSTIEAKADGQILVNGQRVQ